MAEQTERVADFHVPTGVEWVRAKGTRGMRMHIEHPKVRGRSWCGKALNLLTRYDHEVWRDTMAVPCKKCVTAYRETS